MTTYEIFISIAILLLSAMTFIDKINNRKNEKREDRCKEHQHLLANLQQIVQGLQLEKADNDELNDLKSEISGLKADISSVKEGNQWLQNAIQRIENLIMARKL